MNESAERLRITARVSSTSAATLNTAAALMGTTLRSFVVQAALEKAHSVIEREHLIQISRNNAAMLLDLLDAPPKPNAARVKAYKRFIKEKYGVE